MKLTFSKVLIAGLVVGALAALVWIRVGGSDDGDAAAFETPDPTGEKVPAGLERFYAQELVWSDCGKGATCTTVEVPTDYADPERSSTELKLTVIPARGDGGRTLFVNPGGPGGSAIEYAPLVARNLSDEVRDQYSVVGLDPRGVGQSSPLDCLDDRAFDDFVALDPTPDDPEEIALLEESIDDLAQACRINSGLLAEHVSTTEAARDFDIVRALLGAEKLDWFGASYGTFLGATYATLFPDRVGRMVLDGAVDPTQDSIGDARGQATGFGVASEAFAQWCAETESCTLGDTPEAVLSQITSLLGRLDVKPIKGLKNRQLTEGIAFFGIALPMYSEDYWPLLAKALETAIGKNDGAALNALSDTYFRRQADGVYATNIGQVISAVNCLDSPGGPTPAEIPALEPEFRDLSAVFGRALLWGAVTCGRWPYQPAEPPLTITGKGAPPILVVGTTRDPATPYESAVALAKQLESGVLITRDGDGHTAFGMGNDCIDDTINTFFADGTVPTKDPQC